MLHRAVLLCWYTSYKPVTSQNWCLVEFVRKKEKKMQRWGFHSICICWRVDGGKHSQTPLEKCGAWLSKSLPLQDYEAITCSLIHTATSQTLSRLSKLLWSMKRLRCSQQTKTAALHYREGGAVSWGVGVNGRQGVLCVDGGAGGPDHSSGRQTK